MAVLQTNDGVQIYYQVKGEGKALLLLPGWTCSTRFFDKNAEVLSQTCKVILMDFRGHGQSEKVDHGHRIARYAMDVKNLLDYLELEDVTALGWSMGSAVLWSYLELFGQDRIKKLICVDQAPLQYTGPDWAWGQNGCYDVEMFIRLCADLKYAHKDCAVGTVYGCMHRQPTEDELQFLSAEILNCPATVAIEIMRDHTNLDWRDFVKRIDVPALVCVARQSKVFDWQGSAWVGENIKGAKTVFLEESGHMLFWEEPDKFNQVVAEFVGN